jgi:hypothetical protein
LPLENSPIPPAAIENVGADENYTRKTLAISAWIVGDDAAPAREPRSLTAFVGDRCRLWAWRARAREGLAICGQGLSEGPISDPCTQPKIVALTALRCEAYTSGLVAAAHAALLRQAALERADQPR